MLPYFANVKGSEKKFINITPKRVYRGLPIREKNHTTSVHNFCVILQADKPTSKQTNKPKQKHNVGGGTDINHSSNITVSNN